MLTSASSDSFLNDNSQ